MKKTALILLILIYSMSSFGVTFKEFYCCGKLKAVSVLLSDVSKDKSAKEIDKDGCCKTKLQSFKVKDTHIATEKATATSNLYVALPVTIPSLLPSPLIENGIIIINGSHAPPLHAGVPIYISNCVFRI